MAGRARTLLVLVALGAATPARAERGAGAAPEPSAVALTRGIVLEVYPGQRDAAAEDSIAPVVAALSRRGFATGPAQVGAAIVARVSRPARVLDQIDASELTRSVRQGYQAFLAGDFDRAVEALAGALAVAHDNPGLIAHDQSMPAVVQQAHLGLAQAYRRLGRDREAYDAMAALIRSYPNLAIDARAYSPEIRTYQHTVLLELARLGHGGLVVDVDDRSAIIFVDEIFRGQGKVELEDLVPGAHRVFVRLGDDDGRSYDVDVTPGKWTRLAVDWRFDAALETPPTWTGLVMNGDDVEARAVAYATRIGRAVETPTVLLVGPRVGGGGLVGTVIDVDSGKVTRRAEVDSADAPDQNALARFLAGQSVAGVTVLVGDGASDDGRPRRSRTGAVLSALGAGALLATAGVAFALDGDCIDDAPPGVQCEDVYHTKALGIATGLGGVALGALSVALFVKASGDDAPDQGVALVVQPGGAGAWAFFRF